MPKVPSNPKKRTYSSLHASNRAVPASKGRPIAVKSVKFDEEARREFLTGFSKRKKERQEERKKRREGKEKEERGKLRAEVCFLHLHEGN
ncbi:hypothetical protein BT69DRAFT_68014 [Atractiella rhizophila]|nr:hypothetical protein BT69DRAFT_68014 [Atractiella rhizophila]